MTSPFGQDITYWFFPLVDDASPASGFPTSQTPAIYVYQDEPSRSDAAAGTGSPLQSIASWTWDAGRQGWYFTISAISDPEPTSSQTTRTYWVAINFVLKAAGQTQTVLRTLDLLRVTGHTSDVVISDADLEAYIPQVGAYTTDSQRLAFASQAVGDVKAKLRTKGYAWAQIHRPDRLKQVATFRALSMICLSQIKQQNDDFAARFVEFRDMYKGALEELQFEYDADNDGTADTKASGDSVVLLVR